MVIGVLVARQPGINRLSEKPRYLVLDVFAGSRFDDKILRHLGEPHHLIKLSYQ